MHVRDGSGMFMRRTRLVTCDIRTSIYWTSNSAENIGPGHGLATSGCMHSESSSRSGRYRGAAVEVDTIRKQQLKREQQPKQMQSGSSWSRRNWGAAAEADTSGEQQLKRMQTGSSSWSGRNRGAETQHRELSGAGLLMVGEQGGSSWASEANEATCILCSLQYNSTS